MKVAECLGEPHPSNLIRSQWPPPWSLIVSIVAIVVVVVLNSTNSSNSIVSARPRDDGARVGREVAAQGHEVRVSLLHVA